MSDSNDLITNSREAQRCGVPVDWRYVAEALANEMNKLEGALGEAKSELADFREDAAAVLDAMPNGKLEMDEDRGADGRRI